jgi:transcriptional regulator with XRE-family HTH domain
MRALRRDRRMTQRDVAAAIPMSGGHLSRLETGEYGPPPDETIERLAEIFETDPDELFQIAGRAPSESHFEQRVLAELRAIRAQLRQLAERLDG